MKEVPALDQLMGAYFHQDWDLDSNSERDVVDLFVADSPTLAAALPAEIHQVLKAVPTEAELRYFILTDLGGCYVADADGGTYREWLTQIADRVRATAGQR